MGTDIAHTSLAPDSNDPYLYPNTSRPGKIAYPRPLEEDNRWGRRKKHNGLPRCSIARGQWCSLDPRRRDRPHSPSRRKTARRQNWRSSPAGRSRSDRRRLSSTPWPRTASLKLQRRESNGLGKRVHCTWPLAHSTCHDPCPSNVCLSKQGHWHCQPLCNRTCTSWKNTFHLAHSKLQPLWRCRMRQCRRDRARLACDCTFADIPL
mmetsp:Transcript_146523/g.272886  ORF Transcript_146523/g.272886 Transcript_146523/m.272886 type:complete len:206 (-) Transcript_146523:2730-3347(-)